MSKKGLPKGITVRCQPKRWITNELTTSVGSGVECKAKGASKKIVDVSVVPIYRIFNTRNKIHNQFHEHRPLGHTCGDDITSAGDLVIYKPFRPPPEMGSCYDPRWKNQGAQNLTDHHGMAAHLTTND